MATKLKPRPTSFRKPGTPKTATRKSIVSIPKLLPDQPGYASVTIAARGDRPEHQYRVFGEINAFTTGKIIDALVDLWKEEHPGVEYSTLEMMQWEYDCLTRFYPKYIERACTSYYVPLDDALPIETLMMMLTPAELEDIMSPVLIFTMGGSDSKNAPPGSIPISQSAEPSASSSSE